jgi:hypothetical protein
MANVHATPGEEFADKIYFDSSMPGSFIYTAEETLNPWATKDSPHPALAQFALLSYNWSLNGERQPEQRAQYYFQLREKQELYGRSAARKGSYYYGPDAPVISATLRPRGARPLEVVNDN